MQLIPSIDLRAGRCVRLREGEFASQITYRIEPAALVQRYQRMGARWLHLVDLDGARDGVMVNSPIIEGLARRSAMCLQVGGGIRSPTMIERLLSAGVARVVIGSVAVEKPLEVAGWLRSFGADRICLAFDVRTASSGEPAVHTHGWSVSSSRTLWDALEGFPAGTLKHVLCTDIARDGTLRGPNLPLYRLAVGRYPALEWQASGGIRNTTDLAELARLSLAAAVSGRALIEERILLKELRQFLPAASSPASTSATAR